MAEAEWLDQIADCFPYHPALVRRWQLIIFHIIIIFDFIDISSNNFFITALPNKFSFEK